MANENRLKVEITKSGYQAAIDNSRDANGFKIKISKADVYDDKNNLRGTFDVVGKNIGQQQITLRTVIFDKTNSYGIKTIKLIDEYSGVEFAIISHPDGEMIDYINPHKIAYISCNLIITSLEDHTVTIIDSSSVDADMGVIDGQIAAIWEAIEHLPGVNLPGNQDTSGNAATASRLLTERQIGGVAFDGTKDIDLPGVNLPGNQDTSGNAATASKLTNACKIGGVSFDGTKDIDLPGVNKPGNQNTSGNANTATKLQTARKITLNGAVAGSCSFNGEGDAVINTTQVIGLGINQDWVDVTPWRTYGTVYVNQTQSPIYLSISFYHTNKRQAELWIDNVLIGEVTTSNEDSQRKALSGIVQPGKGYILNGNLDIRTWSELRRG